MADQRTTIPDFNLYNPFYAGATVSVFTIDELTSQKTTTLATLYQDLTSALTLDNPQKLDSNGRFQVPVYVDQPVIMTISGLLNADDHDTGIVAANLLGTAVTDAQAAASQSIAFSELAKREAARASKFANLQLPDPLGSNDYVRGDGASGYERRTTAQVRSDIGAGGISAANTWSGNNDFSNRLGINGSLGAPADSLTISAGAITPSRFRSRVDTEAAASSDDLDSITLTNIPDDGLFLLGPESTARVVTVTSGVGNIQLLQGNYVMDADSSLLLLQRIGSQVFEITRGGTTSPANWIYGSDIDFTNGGADDLTSLTIDVSTLVANGATDIQLYLEGLAQNSANQQLVLGLADSGGDPGAGYDGKSSRVGATGASGAAFGTDEFDLTNDVFWDASIAISGWIKLKLADPANNTWSFESHLWHSSGSTSSYHNAGELSLTNALESLIIGTAAGTALFNAGGGRLRSR